MKCKKISKKVTRAIISAFVIEILREKQYFESQILFLILGAPIIFLSIVFRVH